MLCWNLFSKVNYPIRHCSSIKLWWSTSRRVSR